MTSTMFDLVWERERHTSGRRHVTKENIGNSVARLVAAEPALQNRVRLVEPWESPCRALRNGSALE